MLEKTKKTVSAVVAAALVAGAITLLMTGSSDKVVASAPLNSGKGDRLDIRPLGTQCSQQAWPYFEARCTRDRRHAMGEAKPVRIVSTSRANAEISGAKRTGR
jgi:hypothetical protein